MVIAFEKAAVSNGIFSMLNRDQGELLISSTIDRRQTLDGGGASSYRTGFGTLSSVKERCARPPYPPLSRRVFCPVFLFWYRRQLLGKEFAGAHLSSSSRGLNSRADDDRADAG